MVAYATVEELDEELEGSPYESPDTPVAERMLRDASDLIDVASAHAGDFHWVDPRPDPFVPTTHQSALIKATLEQVVYMLEVGEEHNVIGPIRSVQVGRVTYPQIGRLAPKARDTLWDAGLLQSRVSIR